MKVIFKVEKNYNGKTYYPNIEYVVDDETAKDILSKTKYAEKVEDRPFKSGNEEQRVDENEQKPTKKNKNVAKNAENSQ